MVSLRRNTHFEIWLGASKPQEQLVTYSPWLSAGVDAPWFYTFALGGDSGYKWSVSSISFLLGVSLASHPSYEKR